MPCLLGCLALSVPRVVIILVAIFSNYFPRAYDNVLWPILGFFFLPTTTLAYAYAMNANNRSASGIYLVIVVIAVLIDLGLLGGSSKYRKYWKK